MTHPKFLAVTIGLLVIAVSIFLYADGRPQGLGIAESRLTPCPTSPNCVSSDERASKHNIAALRLKAPAIEVWKAAALSISAQPGAVIRERTPDYLHAEYTSAVVGFIDDLELHLRVSEGIIAVRSASRVGYSDFGVNRQRVEDLRAALIEQGLVQ